MQITQETRKRFLKSVLKNFHEYGFSYRSVIDEDGESQHGLTIDRATEEVFATEISHLRVTHVGDRGRKIGMLIVNERGAPPTDLIADFGAAREEDMRIADRCIEGGSSA